jgi:hypothetical protein
MLNFNSNVNLTNLKENLKTGSKTLKKQSSAIQSKITPPPINNEFMIEM